MSKIIDLTQEETINYEKFSPEVKKGLSLFKEWVSKIPVENLENNGFGLDLVDICTSDHDTGDDYRPDLSNEMGEYYAEYSDCCIHSLHGLVVSLCIFSGSSIKEANDAASFASDKKFWRKDVVHKYQG